MQINFIQTAMITFSRETLGLLIGIGSVLVVVFLLAVIIPFVRDFRRELRYLDMEIRRNRGKERQHWERKKRRLWLSLLPFVRYK